MTDDKKISGKLTEQQLEMGLELLEKRAAVERKAPPRKKTGAQMKEAAAKALQKALPKTKKAKEKPAEPEKEKAAQPAQESPETLQQPQPPLKRGRRPGPSKQQPAKKQEPPAAKKQESRAASAPRQQNQTRKKGRSRDKEQRKPPVRITPLGGMLEVGKNITAYECMGDMFLVDCGMTFPDEQMLGVDLVLPEFTYAVNNRDRLRGIVITHGHEDHLGAIAQVWPTLQCPVYGTDFSLGLVRERLSEYKMQELVPLISVNQKKKVVLDGFEVEFIPIAHSIPETSALFIKTANGNIMHATDWRFDDNKLSMVKTDFAALERAAAEGVDVFVCDSTNVMVDEPQASEEDVRNNLIKIIPEMQGGVVATCFASNIMRLESLILAARAANRTPVLVGRSLVTNVKIITHTAILWIFIRLTNS